MSDQMFPEQGARPWLPAGNVAALATLNQYDIPLAGLVEQSGSVFLYACLLGELETQNVWAYARLTQDEVRNLDSLLDDDLSAAIDQALADRMLVVAVASDHRLVDWLPIDAGVEGPLGIVRRFLGRLTARLQETQRDVEALERQPELASR